MLKLAITDSPEILKIVDTETEQAVGSLVFGDKQEICTYRFNKFSLQEAQRLCYHLDMIRQLPPQGDIRANYIHHICQETF